MGSASGVGFGLELMDEVLGKAGMSDNFPPLARSETRGYSGGLIELILPNLGRVTHGA